MHSIILVPIYSGMIHNTTQHRRLTPMPPHTESSAYIGIAIGNQNSDTDYYVLNFLAIMSLISVLKYFDDITIHYAQPFVKAVNLNLSNQITSNKWTNFGMSTKWTNWRPHWFA